MRKRCACCLPKQYDILVTALGASEKAPGFEQVTEKLLAGEIDQHQ